MQQRSRGSSLLLAGLLLTGAPALGQEGPTVIQFSFSNPGARSLGLGGAFAALADDATTAFANPAGLVQLNQPEISMEGRWWSYSSPYTRGGRASGRATGIGIDTSDELLFDTSSDDLSSVSYLSYVYPRPHWAFALYRHQLARFQMTSEIRGLFAFDQPGFPGESRLDDGRQRLDLDAVSYGVAGGWSLDDELSIGLGLALTEVDFVSAAEGFRPLPGDAGFYAENPLSDELLSNRASFVMNDEDLTFSVGLLWKPSVSWSFGGFFRSGADVPLEATQIAGPAFRPGVASGTVLASDTSKVGFPDVFGVGIAYRSPGGAATLGFEWDRVEYSDLVDELSADAALAIEDADEIRVGIEYVFLRRDPIVALRAGGWVDPDHRLRSTSGDPFEEAVLRGDADELHFALGLGLAFPSFQIDLGVDLSDLVDTATLSAIYSF